MREKPAARQPFNINRFYMWRCVVAMAHADGLVDAVERDYLLEVFINMRKNGLPEDRYQALIEDLAAPRDIADMLAHVHDPDYRAQVVYFARLLAFQDGHFHPDEQALLEKLHAHAMDGTDLEEIRKQVEKTIERELAGHAARQDHGRPDRVGLAGLLDAMALRFGFDLMEE